MDIGRTNKRITFCRYEEKENALSQTEQTLTEVKTVWASVEPTRGREYQEAQRVRPELTYKVTTRYHKEVTPDMYNIEKVLGGAWHERKRKIEQISGWG